MVIVLGVIDLGGNCPGLNAMMATVLGGDCPRITTNDNCPSQQIRNHYQFWTSIHSCAIEINFYLLRKKHLDCYECDIYPLHYICNICIIMPSGFEIIWLLLCPCLQEILLHVYVAALTLTCSGLLLSILRRGSMGNVCYSRMELSSMG